MTMTYRGKRSERRVIDPADDARLMCCWTECEKDGYELYKAREYLGTNPNTGSPMYTWYVFCCERHKMYWVNSVRDLNNLPPGYKLAVI